MIEFENTIFIGRPIGSVFAFLAKLENIPKWNYYILEVTKRSDGPIDMETIYHQVRKTDEQDLRIAMFHPNHQLVIKTLPQSSPSFEMTLTLSDGDCGTCIRDAWKLDTGWTAPLERLGVGSVKADVAENLEKLKELLERGRVVLQDGRLATL
jgi:hypothetical protein